jgi:hypothetical protein
LAGSTGFKGAKDLTSEMVREPKLQSGALAKGTQEFEPHLLVDNFLIHEIDSLLLAFYHSLLLDPSFAY